jgi:hypothetical protein
VLWESRGELEVGEDLMRWEEMRGEKGEEKRRERIGERVGERVGERRGERREEGAWENPLPRVLWESRGELEVGEDLVGWEEMRGEKRREKRG